MSIHPSGINPLLWIPNSQEVPMLTSAQWNRKLYPEVLVYDPDGWDRRDYEFSFNVELVTEEEFERRLGESTKIILKRPVEGRYIAKQRAKIEILKGQQ